MSVITQSFGAAPVPIIPDSAPFTADQRAWLNGFLAGLYGGAESAVAAAPAVPAEDFPWHDPALELDERLTLAEGRALPRRLMAAMAQLDCGQCGYLCQTYAEALAEGRETSTALCQPGGKVTRDAVKRLMADVKVAPVAAPVAAKPRGETTRLLASERLTGAASGKDVRRIVLDLSGTGITYAPGDSLGVVVRNDPELVQACLTRLNAQGDDALREALSVERDIARPLDRTLDLLAGAARDPREGAALRKLADGDDGAEPAEADLLDLLEAFPSAHPPVADLIASLPTLKPRLYSIASSLRATPGRVELCVGVVRETRRGRLRDGVASCHLAFRADAVPAYTQTSHFRLPERAETPVIMVGPGTGIAPFRAFLQERAALGIKGRSWLFFGDRHAATDFLFADEIAAWKKDGTLQRLSLAWSRDGKAKDYVQHRMIEDAADLWRWLQDGGHFYVCGDASRMAKDVDGALRQIAMSEGAMSADQARDWIVALAKQGRYQRDVY
ncbi:sulfite reductase subunit alpha [Sediminicoccus sp. KRV36]|uniref:sulfite reductase subunit alpha n=1 Tax=Sediminicoccus sp. KRV36 TaxID=3133721 RepID=UPI00200E5BB6|nr:sulfite reductase subunit alpha [Sediminicoccus rosea]UPY36251.1 sulfite reductase subunit alpha [Sediminicoccus rosea]